MSSVTSRIHQLTKKCPQSMIQRCYYRYNNPATRMLSSNSSSNSICAIIGQRNRIRQRQEKQQLQQHYNDENRAVTFSSLTTSTGKADSSNIHFNPFVPTNESCVTYLNENSRYYRSNFLFPKCIPENRNSTEPYGGCRRLYSTSTATNNSTENDLQLGNSGTETSSTIPLNHDIDNNNHHPSFVAIDPISENNSYEQKQSDDILSSHSTNSDSLLDHDHQPTTGGRKGRKKPLSIYEMDATRLNYGNYTQEELEELVRQLENMEQLTASDIGPLLLPLTRKIGMIQHKRDTLQSAILMERILFHCLSRLPAEYYTGTDDDKIRQALESRIDLPYPPAALYNRCIIGWGNLKMKDSADRAEKIFHFMLDEYNREYNFLHHPNIRSYIERQQGTLVQDDNQLPNNDDVNNTTNKQSSVRFPKHDNNDNNDDTEIDNLIKTLNQSKEELDQSSMIVNNNNIYNVQSALPNRKTYKSIIRALATANDGQEPKRAYDYLCQVERLSGVYRLIDDYENCLAEKKDPNLSTRNSGQGRIPNNRNNNNNNKVKTTANRAGAAKLEETPVEYALSNRLEMPDRATYNTVLSAYSKAHVLRHPHSLRRCNQIIYRMDQIKAAMVVFESLPEAASEYELDAFTYHAWLRAYSRYINYAQLAQNHRAAGWAKKYLNNNDNNFDKSAENPVVQATCWLPPSYVHEITTIIQRMHEQQKRFEQQKLQPLNYWTDNSDGNDPTPNIQTPNVPQLFPNLFVYWVYGVLIEALVRTSPLVETIQEANNVLMSMVGKEPNPIQPDFNFVDFIDQNAPIDNIKRPYTAAERQDQDDYYGSNDNDDPDDNVGEGKSNLARNWPRSSSVLLVLQGWQRTGSPLADEKIEALLKATVLGENAPPHARIFYLHKDMQLWENSGWKYSPELCEMMLLQALEYYRKRSSDPRNKAYLKESSVRLKPTGQTFAIAMRAWMKSMRPEAPHRMEIILQKMISLYESAVKKEDYQRSNRNNGSYWFRPREVHFRYLLTAWTQECATGKTYKGITGNGLYPAEHCENLLSLWVQDTDIVDENIGGLYAMAIRAWDKQVLPDTADEGNIPNPVERARILFNQLTTIHNSIKNSKERNDKPDSEPRKVPAYPCNCVLEVCTRPQPSFERQSEAYQTAVDVFRHNLRNARSYELMARVIQRQILHSSLWDQSNEGDVLDGNHAIRQSYKDIIVELFQECCQAGMLTQEMIWHVVEVATAEKLTELFGLPNHSAELITQSVVDLRGRDKVRKSPPNQLLVGNLPPSWSANADRQRGKKQSSSESDQLINDDVFDEE